MKFLNHDGQYSSFWKLHLGNNFKTNWLLTFTFVQNQNNLPAIPSIGKDGVTSSINIRVTFTGTNQWRMYSESYRLNTLFR